MPSVSAVELKPGNELKLFSSAAVCETWHARNALSRAGAFKEVLSRPDKLTCGGRRELSDTSPGREADLSAARLFTHLQGSKSVREGAPRLALLTATMKMAFGSRRNYEGR